jgi:hypothetical protein
MVSLQVDPEGADLPEAMRETDTRVLFNEGNIVKDGEAAAGWAAPTRGSQWSILR